MSYTKQTLVYRGAIRRYKDVKVYFKGLRNRRNLAQWMRDRRLGGYLITGFIMPQVLHYHCTKPLSAASQLSAKRVRLTTLFYCIGQTHVLFFYEPGCESCLSPRTQAKGHLLFCRWNNRRELRHIHTDMGEERSSRRVTALIDVCD
jgi:hypothetical protein